MRYFVASRRRLAQRYRLGLILGDLDGAFWAHEHRVTDRVGTVGGHRFRDHVAPVVVAELENLGGDQLALAVPPALGRVDPRDHEATVNVTGSEVRFPLEDIGM